jgi:hypothetical protein
MLRKLKTLLVVGVAALSIAFAGISIADAKPTPKDPPGYYEHTVTGAIKYFKNGHPSDPSQWVLVQPYEPGWCGSSCDDVVALAEGGIALGYVEDFSHEMGGGYLFGKNLELTGEALATGKDIKIWWFKIPGFALADVNVELLGKVLSFVRSTGVMDGGGLSATYVKTIGIVDINATAFATGTTGCPQFAEVDLRGKVGVGTAGYAYSFTSNSYALTEGSGETIVKVRAHDEDFSTSTWFIFPGVAYADIDGKLIVSQDLFVLAYASPDGTTTFNFGVVTGGNALATGDIDILKIKSSGQVSQSAYATDGVGAAAWGNSMASYNGAVGDAYNGRCVSLANGAGLAVVKGYNQVTNTGNTVRATSHQTAFATTK